MLNLTAAMMLKPTKAMLKLTAVMMLKLTAVTLKLTAAMMLKLTAVTLKLTAAMMLKLPTAVLKPSAAMMLMLCACCLAPWITVHADFIYYKTCGTGPNWYRVTAPKTGYYWLTITVDPPPKISRTLIVSGNRHLACLADYVVTGFGFPLYLHADQRVVLALKNSSYQWRGCQQATGFSMAYISGEAEGDYKMYLIRKAWSWADQESSGREMKPGTNLAFTTQMTNSGWKRLTRDFSALRVAKSGIYWVSARPDPVYQTGTTAMFDVSFDGILLFQVISLSGRSLSTSGAFKLQKGSLITMRPVIKTKMQSATLLSCIFLASNRRPYTGQYLHVAWTSTAEPGRHYRSREYISFDRHPETNYGNMYDPVRRKLIVTVTGSYLLSLRMRSRYGGYVTGVVYQNNVYRWESYGEDGVASGQSVALPFKEGDVLHLQKHGGQVGDDTMLSLAFIAP